MRWHYPCTLDLPRCGFCSSQNISNVTPEMMYLCYLQVVGPSCGGCTCVHSSVASAVFVWAETSVRPTRKWFELYYLYIVGPSCGGCTRVHSSVPDAEQSVSASRNMGYFTQVMIWFILSASSDHRGFLRNVLLLPRPQPEHSSCFVFKFKLRYVSKYLNNWIICQNDLIQNIIFFINKWIAFGVT